jgi:POT family proton-dependent oligopeptide transporter
MSDSKPGSDRFPAQIKFIVGNEACERFSYYGMKSILSGYITGAVLQGGLGRTGDESTVIIHTFVAVNYFMPLLGAWLSDRLIGRYYTILWVSLFYCAGHGVLACSDLMDSVQGKLWCLFAGLALVAFGSGGIKPCVSAFMGDQFKPEQSHLLQKAYGAFYWAINFGSFFSFLLIPWIKSHYGYSWAFGVPGILMGLATFIFWLGTRHYVRIPPSRELKHAGFFAVFFQAIRAGNGHTAAAVLNVVTTIALPAIAIVMMTYLSFANLKGAALKWVGWSAVGCVTLWYLLILVLSFARRMELPEAFWRKAGGKYSNAEIESASSLSPILFIFAFVPVFWSLFDQTNSTWVQQGERMTPYVLPLFNFTIGAEQMQSANPAIVMVLVPLITLLVYPRIGRFASPLKRMTFGMILAGVAYVIVAIIQRRIEAGEQLSVLWQLAPYVVLTTGEVLFSATGLEFAFREAKAEMKSTIMSFWLLTVTLGGLFVVTVTKLFGKEGNHAASVTSERFLQYAGIVFVVTILFAIVTIFYRYRDPAAAEGR